MRRSQLPKRDAMKKYNLQILLTAGELDELERMYGATHGLGARVRSDLMALARARHKRNGGIVAGVHIPGDKYKPTLPPGSKPPVGGFLNSWLKTKLTEKYGVEKAAEILGESGQAATPRRDESSDPTAE